MSTPPRILIVTYNWPPRNAIGTHRPYTWARYWRGVGAQVTVLTARKRIFDEPLDLLLPELEGVRVVEVPYGGGDLKVARRLFLDTSILGYLRRIKRVLQKSTSMTVDLRQGWFKAAFPLVADLAVNHDFVVSTFGPAASHLIANAVKRANPAVFWVADYRDLWSQDPQSNLPQATLKKMRLIEEASVGKNADLVTAVSEDMILRLSEFFKGNTLLVPNGFDVQEAELNRVLSAPFRESVRPIQIVHTGTITAGHRDPLPLLEAIADMVSSHKLVPGEVFLDFYGRSVNPIRELQKNPKFKPFLRVFGHVAREVALKAQRDADLLLLLESDEAGSRGVITGKIFEYIVSGRPIICVGSDPAYEIGALLRRTGTGKVLRRCDREEMAAVVMERLQNAGPPAWFAPAMQEITRYARRTQALALLDEMVKRGGRRC